MAGRRAGDDGPTHSDAAAPPGEQATGTYRMALACAGWRGISRHANRTVVAPGRAVTGGLPGTGAK
jgi:hypothetical protein